MLKNKINLTREIKKKTLSVAIPVIHPRIITIRRRKGKKT